jgi:uncharacterized protein
MLQKKEYINKKLWKFYFCLIILTYVIPIEIFAASFDCSKASNATEKTICDDTILSKLDDDLAIAYNDALKESNRDKTKKSQRKWLKETWAQCLDDKVCIKKVYENRLHQLNVIAKQSKEEKDNITGAYQYPLSKGYDNRYPAGELEVLKVSQDKIKFWIYCVLGLPSLNQGDVEGVAELKNDRAFYKDGECEIAFIFRKNVVEVHVSKPWTCGNTGHNVNYEGIYKLKSRKLEALQQE